MRKTVNRTRYIVAFFITFLIFFFGFLLGLVFKNERSNILTEELDKLSLEYSNMLLQYQYTSELEEEKNCEFLSNIFQTQLENLNTHSQRIQDYSTENKLSNTDYKKLRQAYTIQQIDYWILSKKIKNLCGLNYSQILYFFNTKNECPLCSDQGIHLDYVKRLLGEDVLIFALDGDEEGIIKLLKMNYNVISYPTLVIDEKKYGFSTNKEILQVVCHNKKNEKCIPYQD